MSAEAAITALIHTYAQRLDDGDIDGVVAMFEHAEIGAVGRDGFAYGVEGARSQYEPVIIYPDGTPRTMHLITNVTTTVESDTASATSYFTVLQAIDGTYQPIIGGRYHDRFTCVDGAWRFSRRVFEPRLIGDLSRHLRIDFGLEP